jgi:hypothetical protein
LNHNGNGCEVERDGSSVVRAAHMRRACVRRETKKPG